MLITYLKEEEEGKKKTFKGCRFGFNTKEKEGTHLESDTYMVIYYTYQFC